MTRSRDTEGGSVAVEETLTGWRKKDRERFSNPDLVAVCYETECREVFDYHERIWDRIDAERRNGFKASIFTLAREIHDDRDAHDVGWFDRRQRAFEEMRNRGLICFDGEVSSSHHELAISVPAKAYSDWCEDNWRSNRAHAQPRGSRGRFASQDKTPAPTDSHRNGTATVPHGTANGDAVPITDRIHRYTETEIYTEKKEQQPQTARAHTHEAEPLDALAAVVEDRVTEVFDPSAKAEDAIVKARRELGSIAMDADTFAASLAKQRNIDTLLPIQALREVYEPAVTLTRRFNRDVVSKALAAGVATTVNKPASFLESVCVSEAAKPTAEQSVEHQRAAHQAVINEKIAAEQALMKRELEQYGEAAAGV